MSLHLPPGVVAFTQEADEQRMKAELAAAYEGLGYIPTTFGMVHGMAVATRCGRCFVSLLTEARRAATAAALIDAQPEHEV